MTPPGSNTTDSLLSVGALPRAGRHFALWVIRWSRSGLLKYGALVAACGLFLGLQMSGGHVVSALDDAAAAARMRVIQSAPTDELVVVTIDSASLHAVNTWPWPRERYATAIENLREAGADLIAFDIDFSAASSDLGDAALKAAVDASPGTIILPTFVQADGDLSNAPNLSVGDTPIFGNANVEIEGDGRVRHYRNGYNSSDGYRPTIAAVLAGAPYGDTSAFLLDFGIRTDQIDQVSFEDVYQGRIDPAQLAGRHVLIGATALELGDAFSTPVTPAMPGVLVHALAFENMSSGRMLVELNRPVTIALGFLALLLLWPRRDRIELPRLFLTHVVVFGLVLTVPLAIQAIAPISLNLFSVALAQALCLWAGVQRELNRRSAEIVRQREDHLSFIAMHEPETGLPNRRAMLARIEALLAPPSQEQVNVLMVGIDRFATLRAAIGFSRANEVVLQFCKNLQATIVDVEVFHLTESIIGVVFLPTDRSAGAEWMRSGLVDIDAVSATAGQDIELRVRTGSASSNFEGATAERLIERATIALDSARQEDRPHRMHDELTCMDPRLQLELATGIERGMELGEFRLVYQAKVSADDGAVRGAEALLRWDHAELGSISPTQFIPVAEETGAIDRLTLWVLDRAIQEQAVARASGIYIPISVNLSARTLCNPRFGDAAIKKISRGNADICLEITETAVIESIESARESIAAFRAAGIRVSIDDFGSGLSSLMYLKQIEADELKLDSALLAEIAASKRDQTIIQSTIELAHGLGMTVVAEGIENQPMSRLLADLGCDLLQGYHYGRPMSVADFIESAAGAQVVGKHPVQKKAVA